MEIYNGRPVTQRLTMPLGFSSPTLNILKDGTQVLAPINPEFGKNYVMAPIPYAATLVDGPLTIVVNFQIDSTRVTKEFTVNVTTPLYADIDEIRDALGADEERFTDAQLATAERRIRGVINKYTNQDFGRQEGTKKIVGTGESQLRLTDRLAVLTNISGPNVLVNYSQDNQLAVIDNGSFYDVRGDGYFIGVATSIYGSYAYTNPIRDPDSTWDSGGFIENASYFVTGVWGWESVPSDVKEAALILIEDALCPDSEYRDRYVGNYKAADWRVEYSDRAFRGTGSVMADQLLDSYRRWSMTVI